MNTMWTSIGGSRYAQDINCSCSQFVTTKFTQKNRIPNGFWTGGLKWKEPLCRPEKWRVIFLIPCNWSCEIVELSGCLRPLSTHQQTSLSIWPHVLQWILDNDNMDSLNAMPRDKKTWYLQFSNIHQQCIMQHMCWYDRIDKECRRRSLLFHPHSSVTFPVVLWLSGL